MLKNTEIAKYSLRYTMQTLVAVVVLALAVLSLHMFAHVDGLVAPLVVSVVFALVVELADIYLWKRIAEANQKCFPHSSLPCQASVCCWLSSLSWAAT